MIKKLSIFVTAFGFLVASATVADAAKTVDINGEKVKIPKKAKICTACHFFAKGKPKKVGPPLWGVFNRAPSIQGMPWDKWTEENIHTWLTKPKAVKPSTPMSFPGYKKEADRQQVIDFLKKLHD